MKRTIYLCMCLTMALFRWNALAVDTLPENRILLFNDYSTNGVWTHEGTTYASGFGSAYKALLMGTNHFHKTGWILRNCRTGCSGYLFGGQTVPTKNPTSVPTSAPYIAVNLAANLQNMDGAMIESPILTNGIGTIYFDAINGLPSYPTEITIQFATNMSSMITGNSIGIGGSGSTNDYVYNWNTLDVTNLNAATESDFVRYTRLLNYRQPIKLLIRRTGVLYPYVEGGIDNAFAIIDNIRVSAPPTDVVITKTDVPFEPGYPSIGTNLTIRCYVSNADANVPTTNRVVKVYYRWQYLNQNQMIGAWQSNNMSYVVGTGSDSGNGNTNRYQVTLPSFSDVGDLEYYFQCDFSGPCYQPSDYTGSSYSSYNTENLSPEYLRAGGTGREYYARLRPFASQYGHFYAVVDQFAAPIEMSLSGDREWRAMVPLAGTGLTNVTWRFKATEWYVPGSESVSTGALYWAGASGVSGGRVPYGGVCVATNVSGQLNVTVDSGNYLKLTFDTEQLQYLATRAEYQNFNSWTADAYLFSESSGQDPKHSVINTFDQWATNTDSYLMEAVNIPVASTNVYTRTPFTTVNGWEVGSAAYVVERTLVYNTINDDGRLGFRNLALRLKGATDASLGLGYAHFSNLIELDGLKNVGFKCRLGQSADNYDVAWYLNGLTNTNYAVRMTVETQSTGRSPEEHSVSIIGYYQHPGRFYEYRITQAKDTRDTAAFVQDKLLRHELYRWVDGVATRIASNNTVYYGTLTVRTAAEMRFYNTSSSATLIKCKYASTDVISYSDTRSPVIQKGTFGVLSAECVADFSGVTLLKTDLTGAAVETSLVTILATTFDSATALDAWYLPSGRFELKTTSPAGIYTSIPAQQIGVYSVDTTYGSGDDAPAAGDSRWQLINSITVTNFTYQTSSLTFNTWKSKFIMLQVVGGDADVILDELNVASWHGKKSGTANSSDWLATEAWVVWNSTSLTNVVQLDHSRGDPSKDQAIRSLLMTNGLGQMEFDYRVIRAPARLTVQYALAGDENTWYDVRSFDTTNVVGWTHASAYLGTNTVGYFRVLNARTGIFTNALVEINDAVVWDEPLVTSSSWRAYNVKITNADTNRVALDESKFCAFNNSQTAEASPVQDQFEPFLKSPVLPKGLGEISFYARAYTNNQPATLYLYASTNGWNPATNQWFEIKQFQNITNGVYRLYDYTPTGAVGKAYNAVKLGTKTTPGSYRACVDEVVIAEPVFPGFDIVNVTLLMKDKNGNYQGHPQPVAGEDIDVQAQLSNIQMVPSNIVMHVSYYVGTNVWGIGNWPATNIVTREMALIDATNRIYRTSVSIAGQDADAVVQYYVWATYDGGIPLTAQQGTFTNPSWYYPVNLNTTYQTKGWSPYYFVYGVPLHAVWINEINAMDDATVSGYGYWNNAYIEIAVPTWLDLAGWSVDLVNGTGYSTQTIVIPSGLGTKAESTNGYAFFVIGDTFGVSTSGNVSYDLGCYNLNSKIPVAGFAPGGLRLKRPSGIYEQVIAYDSEPTWGTSYSGTNWAAKDPQGQFVYIGRESDGGSLSRIVAPTDVLSTWDSTNTWVFPKTWSPGSLNFGQQAPGEVLQPNVSNVIITSVMELFKGTQNGKSVATYTLKMHVGESTNIVYVVNDWYRLYSLLVDGAEQLNASEMAQGVRTNDLVLSHLAGDVAIVAGVQLRKDLQSLLDNNTITQSVLDWILNYGDGVLAPSYFNGDPMSLLMQYWLNANPTKTNYFVFTYSALPPDPETNLIWTVHMTMNGEKQTVLQGDAVLKLMAKTSMTDGDFILLKQYLLSDASFDTNKTARIFIPNPFDNLLYGLDPTPGSLFSKWVIEAREPRVSVEYLINDDD